MVWPRKQMASARRVHKEKEMQEPQGYRFEEQFEEQSRGQAL